ncbi:hypothetical protein [Azospirillum soli]|uniref:hypothetical protein n=1 Tax=Azospirillum soli TaxID=1304799 RepID=UPI001AE83991|nr:hypothetical protein [Azospirillum soli]MBP2316912.1 energy-coupling factor transporter ATP-binding protein EcfA2 [Azospirillum soli]
MHIPRQTAPVIITAANELTVPVAVMAPSGTGKSTLLMSLLLDEAFASLPANRRAAVLAHLRQRRVTCLLTTHDPVIAALADRVLRLEDGQLHEHFVPQTLLFPPPDTPAAPFPLPTVPRCYRAVALERFTGGPDLRLTLRVPGGAGAWLTVASALGMLLVARSVLPY